MYQEQEQFNYHARQARHRGSILPTLHPCQWATSSRGNVINEATITFWKYRHHSHRSLVCPKSNDKGFQGIKFMSTQGMYNPLSGQFTHPSWLVIDTGYNFNSICSHHLLRSVKPCSKIQLLSNGGTLEYTQFGSLDIIPDIEVYYNQQSITNLISVSVVTSKYRVTMDR